MEDISKQTPIELYYWKVRGRGSLVAQYLAYLKVPFTYTRYTDPAAWVAKKTELMKGGYQFPVIPFIQDHAKGKTVGNSRAILHHLAINYGTDSGFKDLSELPAFEDRYQTAMDLMMAVTTPCLTKDVEAIKKKLSAAYGAMRLNIRMASFVKHLESSDWAFGDRFTYIDVLASDMTELITAQTEELEIEVLKKEDLAILQKHMRRVHSIPQIKAFRESENFDVRPFMPPSFSGFF